MVRSKALLFPLFLLAGGLLVLVASSGAASAQSSDPNYHDCGVSQKSVTLFDFLLESPSLNKDKITASTNDQTLQCLGEHMKNCSVAQGKVKTDNYGTLDVYIEGEADFDVSEEDANLCRIKTEINKKDQVQNQENKKFADTYWNCASELSWFQENLKEKGADLEKTPGVLVPAALSFYMKSVKVNPSLIEKSCKGTIFDVIGQQTDSSQSDQQQEEQSDLDQKEEPAQEQKDQDQDQQQPEQQSPDHSLDPEVKKFRERLSGQIILRVEDKGQAYYVSPKTNTMYLLGKPKEALTVIRDQGVGITTDKLSRIPVALSGLRGKDTDKDGLPDNFEKAMHTDPHKKDTDGDGYTDKQEIQKQHDPAGPGEMNIDKDFAEKQKGKIFLQVENHGEAWYVNPEDGKRYFLATPADAFKLMRDLGRGVSEQDFGKMELAHQKPWDYYKDSTDSENKDQEGSSQKEVVFKEMPQALDDPYISLKSKRVRIHASAEEEVRLPGIVDGEMSCSPKEDMSRVSINGGEYCRLKTTQGATGQTYYNYQYYGFKDGYVIGTEFVLKYPTCGAYPQPKRDKCLAARDNNPPDSVAEEMVKNIEIQ